MTDAASEWIEIMRSEKTGQIITSDPMRFIFLSTLQQENSDYEGRFVIV